MESQTAVEWQHIELSKFIYGKSEYKDANDILIKAKEMEKDQHKISYLESLMSKFQTFDHYWDEKYGGNK
jgi:hypothetical protein